MQPGDATQHTTRATTRLCCLQGLTARPLEGMGHDAIPLERPRPAGAGRRSRSRRDVHPCRSLHAGFAGANRRRPQLRVLGANVSLDGEPNRPFSEPCVRGLPRASHHLPPRRAPGARATACAAARRIGMHGRPARDGGGSHRRQSGCREQAIPPCRAAKVSVTHTRGSSSPKSSAGRRAVRPLVAARVAVWRPHAGRLRRLFSSMTRDSSPSSK